MFAQAEVAGDDAGNIRVNNGSFLAMSKYEDCVGDVVRNPCEGNQLIATCRNAPVVPFDKFSRHGPELSDSPG